jgi:nicotinamide-nucleotide amidase
MLAPMKASVLSIGTELTRGEIPNTNVTWLCEQLTSAGAHVVCTATVDDDPERIETVLRELAPKCNIVVATGGLGPTTDDLTAQTVANVLGVPLQTDEPSLERIKQLVSKHGIQLTASNAKQAALPAGCTVLNNNYGSAPGFMVRLLPDCGAFFLPGVPREMKGLFADHIESWIKSRPGNHNAHQVQLRVFGMPESLVNDTLAGIEEQFGVTVGYRAHFPEVLVKSLAIRDRPEAAQQASIEAAEEIARRLGENVYARGDTSLVSVIADLLVRNGWTLALAESCTGGVISAMVTREPASQYFKGSIVCYDNGVKQRVLGVRAETLESQGAVSESTVVQMAQGVRHVLAADVGLAVSGIAGPSGGSDEKPVGLIHFALATPTDIHTFNKVFSGDREQIQRRAAFAGLDWIRRVLLKTKG